MGYTPAASVRQNPRTTGRRSGTGRFDRQELR
jgi:hypothetical protein